MDVRGEGKGWVNVRGARTPGHQRSIAHTLPLREQEKLWAGLAWKTVADRCLQLQTVQVPALQRASGIGR